MHLKNYAIVVSLTNIIYPEAICFSGSNYQVICISDYLRLTLSYRLETKQVFRIRPEA